ncbi:myb/SANT-like DNA-binding domain-containing protein 4 [Saccostrea cucullata]|uniref:myb/SANT-like DNA-binding domain-containing protein 4 n=1 Tax=Saccostrea cuccullata TaxID=36930 RepID=UPI002ED4AA5E
MARKPNFSQLEIETIIEEVQNNSDIINSSFSNVSTNASKQRLWSGIASKVSAVSGVERTSEDVRKKWRNVSSDTKKKLSMARREARKTGGGVSSAEALTNTEIKIAETMGQTAVEGIPGGYDTAACSTPQSVDIVNEEDSELQDQSQSTSSQSTCSHGECSRESSSNGIHKSSKRKRPSAFDGEQDLIEIEKERLEIEKKRLEIDEERLKIEERRCQLEEERNRRGFLVCNENRNVKYFILSAEFNDFQ